MKSRCVWAILGAVSGVVVRVIPIWKVLRNQKREMKGTYGKEVTQSKWFIAASEEEMK